MAAPENKFPKIIGADLSVDRVVSAPLGAFSPLWFAFGAAASAGVTYWWLTRWMRPTNLEAILATPAEVALIEASPTEVVVEVVDVVAEPAPALEAAAPEPETVTIEVVEAEPEPVAVVEAVVETAPPVIEPEPAPAVVAETAPVEAAPVEAAPKPKPAAKAKPAPTAKPAVVTAPQVKAPRTQPRKR